VARTSRALRGGNPCHAPVPARFANSENPEGTAGALRSGRRISHPVAGTRPRRPRIHGPGGDRRRIRLPRHVRDRARSGSRASSCSGYATA
jgi:hypothetical protein